MFSIGMHCVDGEHHHSLTRTERASPRSTVCADLLQRISSLIEGSSVFAARLVSARSRCVASLTLTALTALAALPGCGNGDANELRNSASRDSTSASAQSAVPARNVSALRGAASWLGEIPCADCVGILTTITLYPNGTYRRQGAYLGTNGGGDTVAAEFGRWTHDAPAMRVRLQGSMKAPLHFAVMSDGALRMLDMNGNDITSAANYLLAAINDAITLTHPARITGAFTYFADAAILVECRSGLQYPVDMSAEFSTLQRAYANANANAQPRVVRLSAHLDERPAMEGSGTMLALIVDSLHGINAGDGCAALRTQDSIAGTAWRLVMLYADSAGPLVAGEDTEAGFVWDPRENRLTGSGGCNRYSARAIMRGTTLVGAAVGATKRFCNATGVMEIEQQFFEVLGADIGLRLEADTLFWSHGPRDVAAFVRRGPYPTD